MHSDSCFRFTSSVIINRQLFPNPFNVQLPDPLIKRLKNQLGKDYKSFEESMQQPPVVSIRLNPKKQFSHSYSYQIPWSKFGYYLNERPQFVFDPLFHAGAYYVQEASSMIIEQFFNQYIQTDHEPLCVLDLCASPGGKSTHILSLLNENDLLVSNEVIESRIPPLKENIIKWGTSNAVITCNDAKDFQCLPEFFDIVFLDAPCSGEGLFRKNKNAISEWNEDMAAMCSARQKRIFNDILPALKVGGFIIYSTCTFNPNENELNVKKWITDFGLKSVQLNCKNEWNLNLSSENEIFTIQMWPHKSNGEGFFISVMQKCRSNELVVANKKILNHKRIDLITKPDSSFPQLTSTYLKFYAFNNSIYFLNENLYQSFIEILSQMNVRYFGTEAGSLKHKNFVCSHNLAMSNHYNSINSFKIELDKIEAIKFLKKENINTPTTTIGWNLLTYKNLNLGWIKNLGNRFNNYYPKEFRIRKSD